MQYALVDNIKTSAQPKIKGRCPNCYNEVYSRCGKVKVWHWAHKLSRTCDDWFEPETEWHRNWKLNFGKENTEVIIEKNGKRHIADIYTNSKVVIELQNSPINVDTIRMRESFYEEKMLWIINGNHLKERFAIF